MSWLKRLMAHAIFWSLIVGLLGGLFCMQLFTLPVHTPGTTVRIRIQPGQSFTHIAAMLKDAGAIDNEILFRFVGRVSGMATRLQAGEFDLNTGWSRLHILRTLASGQEVLYSVSIPEGLTWWQTARRVAQSGLTTFERFKAAIHNPGLLREFDIQADSAEGYLFPETYVFPRPPQGKAEPIVRMMLKEFQQQARTSLWPQGLPKSNRIHELVTLASLVEKETGKSGERRMVAGVFANRLERGMRLQCDPTVIYGLGPQFDGNLTSSDLASASNPYNTYTHSGLPPGPICSPGLASLQAAQDPKEHKYIYFVSKGDGSHHFSHSLQEHNRAVHRYQLR